MGMTLTTQKLKIKEINGQLVQMASLTEKQLYLSMLALKDHDVKVAEETIKADDKVDNLQKVIEEECIKFIATEQPLASDLRLVFTTTKIVTDLERMADYAVDICKLNLSIIKDGLQEYNETAKLLWVMEETAACAAARTSCPRWTLRCCWPACCSLRVITTATMRERPATPSFAAA
jgi:phosphate transport system protein